MAAEVNKELGIETQIVVGSSGEFTVWLDSHATEHELIDQAFGL